jgi:hypothetical protein
MSVKIDRVHSLATTPADLVVIPMHVKTMQKPLTLHPTLHETCLYQYPIAYSHFKDIESDGTLALGDIIVSERLDRATVVWLIGRGDIRRKFDLYAITKALRQIRELDLHHTYSIAFPAIGYYEEDRIDVKLVYRAVKKFLGDGLKQVDFLLHY